MHAIKLLHTHLRFACPSIHQYRLNALMDATRTLSDDQHLSITGIGRGIDNHTSAKHNIKRIDRLVGNRFLHTERFTIYQSLSNWLLKGQGMPIILIDWSDLTGDREHPLLRAAVPVGGRSLTIYEEVHSIDKQANHAVHKHFLSELKQIIPRYCKPIIVTDAGFRGTWFKLVNQLQWHWVGRVRNRDLVQCGSANHWHPCKDLYALASTSPKTLGQGWLSRSQPNAVIFHVIKKIKQGRIAKSKFGQPIRNARSNKIAKREREPWLIVTSPSLRHLTAKQAVCIYAKRMQIEEGFRDIKSERYGLGFTTNLSKTKNRLENLLLLGMLALLIIWMTGMSAIQQKVQYRYQANTLKTRRVLSCIFLGMQVMRRSPTIFSKAQLLHAFSTLQQELNYAPA